MLLGHASIKVTEKHYKPWVKTLQDKLEADAMKGWLEPAKPARRRKAVPAHKSKRNVQTMTSKGTRRPRRPVVRNK